MKAEEFIVGYAQAEGTALEEAAQASLVLCFPVIPLESVFFFVSRQEDTT